MDSRFPRGRLSVRECPQEVNSLGTALNLPWKFKALDWLRHSAKRKLRPECLSTSVHEEKSSVWNLSSKHIILTVSSLLRLFTLPTPKLVFLLYVLWSSISLCAPTSSEAFYSPRRKKKKLNLSLPRCQRGEELGAKLQDGCIFLFFEEGLPHSRTFWRPSQLMLLKCHLALKHDSKGPIWSQKEHIVP